jgi:pimeloyl-ACP methyl ester carboxylesterase
VSHALPFPAVPNEYTPQRVTANGVDFAYLTVGEGPLALCLHGFPDSAHTYRHLLPALADAGFRAVAPFMRGYAPTQVPQSADYQTGALALDACALHDALGGGEPAVIIGHDWGAAATAGAASYEPERWSKVVTMAVPPGGALGRAFFGNPAQLKRSWYMFFFQTGLADLIVPQDDFAFIDMIWRDWSPGYDGGHDAANAKAAMQPAEHFHAAIGYYRALFGMVPHNPDLADAQAAAGRVPPQPTLYLHGRDDGCIGVEVAEDASRELGDSTVTIEIVDGAGHFLHLERPDVVNARILEFVA